MQILRMFLIYLISLNSGGLDVSTPIGLGGGAGGRCEVCQTLADVLMARTKVWVSRFLLPLGYLG